MGILLSQPLAASCQQPVSCWPSIREAHLYGLLLEQTLVSYICIHMSHHTPTHTLWGETQRLMRELQDKFVSRGEPAMAPCRSWGATIAMPTRIFVPFNSSRTSQGHRALTALVYTMTSHDWLYSPTLRRSGLWGWGHWLTSWTENIHWWGFPRQQSAPRHPPFKSGWGAHSTTPGDGMEEASAHWYETGLCFVTLDKDFSLSETGGRVTTLALASVQARAF